MSIIEIYMLISYFFIMISIIGFLTGASYRLGIALIPIYNIYCLAKLLQIRIILLVAFIVFWIVPDKMMVLTPIYIFLPFLLADAYGETTKYAIYMLILPFIFYPLLAFRRGAYIYKVHENMQKSAEVMALDEIAEEVLDIDLPTVTDNKPVMPTNIVSVVPVKPKEDK